MREILLFGLLHSAGPDFIFRSFFERRVHLVKPCFHNSMSETTSPTEQTQLGH